MVGLQQVTESVLKLFLLHEWTTFFMETHGQNQRLTDRWTNTLTHTNSAVRGFKSRQQTFFSLWGTFRGFPFWSAISRNGVVSGSSLPSDQSQHHINVRWQKFWRNSESALVSHQLHKDTHTVFNHHKNKPKLKCFHTAGLFRSNRTQQHHLAQTGSGSLSGFSGCSPAGSASHQSLVSTLPHSASEPSSYCGSSPPAAQESDLRHTHRSHDLWTLTLTFNRSKSETSEFAGMKTHLESRFSHSESVWWISDQTLLQSYKHTNTADLLCVLCVCVCATVSVPVHQLLNQNI